MQILGRDVVGEQLCLELGNLLGVGEGLGLQVPAQGGDLLAQLAVAVVQGAQGLQVRRSAAAPGAIADHLPELPY